MFVIIGIKGGHKIVISFVALLLLLLKFGHMLESNSNGERKTTLFYQFDALVTHYNRADTAIVTVER